ncbi:MAG TPA: glycosyltransferase, partial [Thermoanaerobaculia bacterium]|nr:glycosyltransferase [Thermoanaerobaculia bacterium]
MVTRSWALKGWGSAAAAGTARPASRTAQIGIGLPERIAPPPCQDGFRPGSSGPGRSVAARPAPAPTAAAAPFTPRSRSARVSPLMTERTVVVMPAYNAAGTLETTLRRLPDGCCDEVIVVDDASRDGTAEVAARLPVTLVRH